MTARASAITQGGAARRVLLWVVAALAALALLWTLAVGWWLPRFLQPRIEAAATSALGAPFTIERLEFAPWHLRARLFGLKLGPPDAPWLRIAEIEADASSESFWRFAPVLERLRVATPQVELERIAAGRFNVSPMLDALARRPPVAAEDDEPARFSLNNIRVEGGRIRFVDQVAGSEHRVESLQIGVPFISNLPSHVTVDVEPLLSALINGSPLQLRGKTQPFSEGQRSNLDIDWRGLDVPRWIDALQPLLPQALPIEVKQGRLDLALKVAFERHQGQALPRLHITGGAALSELQAAMPERGLRLAWQRLGIDGLDLRPLERSARVAGIALQAPAAEVDLPRLMTSAAAEGKPSPQTAPAASAAAASGTVAAQASAASGATSNGTPTPTQAKGGNWAWRIERIELADGRVSLQDPAWPAGEAITPLRVEIGGLDSGSEAPPASFKVALADSHGASIALDGTLAVAAKRATLKADVSAARLVPWIAPWQARLPVRVLDGALSLQAQAEAGPGGWTVSDAALQLAALRLQPAEARAPSPVPNEAQRAKDAKASKGAKNAKTSNTAKTVSTTKAARTANKPPKLPSDQIELAKLELAGARIEQRDAAPPVVQAASLRLDGLEVRATRGADGRIGWLPAPNASATPRPSATVPAPASAPAQAAAAPSWRLDEFRCAGCTLAFNDASVQPNASFGLARTQVTVRGLNDDLARNIDFDLAAQSIGGGSLKAAGRVRPQPLSLRSRVDLGAIDLRALQPYLEPYVNIVLASAKASAAGDLALEGSAREPVATARWRGRLALGELRTLDKQNDAEFVRFKTARLDGADLRWAPARLEADLGTVTLEDFYGRVIVNADGRLNLRDVLRREGDDRERSITTPTQAGNVPPPQPPPAASDAAIDPAPAVATRAPAGPPANGAAPPAGAAPALRWREVRIASGTVDFTDNFIRPNYSAKLTDIAGEVSALAWNDPQPAQIKIGGKVDGSAPLEIGGTLHPLGPRLATDITASARGIDITRLTAYSGRYAGYGIEKGTLSLQVRYKVENGKLEASNNLRLDQLTFGDKVDSPSALKLPVLLAVSLLKDRHGVIDVDLPISGSLDDPKFSIGGIIIRVIVNLITKAVTAPFTLLASAFGGKGEELGYVEFAAGSGELNDAARTRLDTLSKALADRPALRLEATGHANAAVDETALRSQHLDRLMRVAKAKSTGELPDSVKIGAEERARWLEAAYKSADLPSKPRNLIGFAKGLPPAEMEALLLQSAPAGDAALRTLADQRGDRVKAYLTTRVPPERVLLTASKLEPGAQDGAGQSSRVAFALK